MHSSFSTTVLIRLVTTITAILLSFLFGWVIYKQIRENYSQSDPVLINLGSKFRNFISQKHDWEPPLDMLNNYNVMDKVELYRGDKSYTINKEKVYICLKDSNGKYYDDNVLSYVLLHEIAHALSTEIGHTQLFHDIFEALLIQFAGAGLYDPNIPIPTDYCTNGDPEM